MLILALFVSIIVYIQCEQNAPPLPKHVFPCGRQIPSIGLGTFGWDTEIKALNSFVLAIDNGFRVFDTANIFANKVALGLAIRQQINAKRVTRKDLFLISKIWNSAHRRQNVIESIKYDLRDLDVDYLDLGLVHYPTSYKPSLKDPLEHLKPDYDQGNFEPLFPEKDHGYLEAYRGMEGAFMLGLIGHIGVANHNIHQLKKILDIAFIRPVVLQVECNPFFRNDKLTNFARSQNMTVMCYAPFRRSTSEFKDDPVLKEIAEKHKKNVHQVALRWNMQRGNVVLPRSHDRRHQRENMEALLFQLDDGEMAKINGIKELPKLHDIPNLSKHPDYPFGANADAE